jgi:hypothetical protein
VSWGPASYMIKDIMHSSQHGGHNLSLRNDPETADTQIVKLNSKLCESNKKNNMKLPLCNVFYERSKAVKRSKLML